MRTGIGCVVVLLGLMGCVVGAAAQSGSDMRLGGRSGLSPVTMQDTPTVLAQAATSTRSDTQQPGYALTTCKDTTSGDDQNTAENGVDPAGWLTSYIEKRDQRPIEPAQIATTKLTLLQSTTHGKLIRHTTDAGLEYYMYQAEHAYKGKDRAVFLAVFEGKTYKVVIDLNVYPVEAIADNMPSTCPPPQLINVTKPSSGFNDYGAQIIDRPRLSRHGVRAYSVRKEQPVKGLRYAAYEPA